MPKPAVWLLFAFLSLHPGLLDNRPNREAQRARRRRWTSRPSWTPPGIAFPFIWLTYALRRPRADGVRRSLRNPALDALVLHLCIGDTWNCITNVERRLGVRPSAALPWGAVFRAVKALGVGGAKAAPLAPSLAWISARAHGVVWNPTVGRRSTRPRATATARICAAVRFQMEATSIRGGKHRASRGVIR